MSRVAPQTCCDSDRKQPSKEGNSGNCKYLATGELYGVCWKRNYSSGEVTHGCQRPWSSSCLQHRLRNPPTTLGQARRSQPNKHLGARNANSTIFTNRLRKTGVSMPPCRPIVLHLLWWLTGKTGPCPRCDWFEAFEWIKYCYLLSKPAGCGRLSTRL